MLFIGNGRRRMRGFGMLLSIPLLLAPATPLRAEDAGGVTVRTRELRIEGSSDAPPEPLPVWKPITMTTAPLQVIGSSDTALPPVESGEMTVRAEMLRVIGEDGGAPAPVADQQGESGGNDNQGGVPGDHGTGLRSLLPSAAPIPGLTVPTQKVPIPPVGVIPQQQAPEKPRKQPVLTPPTPDPKALQPQMPGTFTDGKKPPVQDSQQSQGKETTTKKPVENVEPPPILPPSTIQPKKLPLK